MLWRKSVSGHQEKCQAAQNAFCPPKSQCCDINCAYPFVINDTHLFAINCTPPPLPRYPKLYTPIYQQLHTSICQNCTHTFFITCICLFTIYCEAQTCSHPFAINAHPRLLIVHTHLPKIVHLHHHELYTPIYH